MKTVKLKGADIQVPSGDAFAYQTPPEMPKCHGVFVAVARRGGGKSVAISNLVRMMSYDRVFLVSPTAKSNRAILEPLGIAENDVFEDVDDPNVIQKVIDEINTERDDYEQYHRAMKEYKKFLSYLNKDDVTKIPDDLLISFYRGGQFEPPSHRWGGRKPKLALIVDDCQNSKVFTSKTLPAMVVKGRHYGQLKKGGAIGVSVFLMCQNFKCVGGGLPKSIRGNSTGWLLFKNYNDKEKMAVAEELAFSEDKEQFITAWDAVCDSEPHAFMFVDMNKKTEHLSPYRKNFNEFLILQ